MSLTLKPLSPAFGAEITGLDLTRPLDPGSEAEVVAAIDRWGVCVYPATGLTDETHIHFSRLFGNLYTTTGAGAPRQGPARVGVAAAHTPQRRARFAYAQLFDAGNLTIEGGINQDPLLRTHKHGDRLWHTDASFTPDRCSYSLLLAHETPKVGGDTFFADMRGAYDALPQAMKSRIEHLVADHSVFWSRKMAGYPFTEEEVDAKPSAQHPLVHIHPGSGRKSLYIAAHARDIVGMPREEGRALLKELMDFATQPQFVISHHWAVGDLVIWDNFSTMHRGSDYDDLNERRDMRRTTVIATPRPPITMDPRFAEMFTV
jgi:alpha-ketoglutarate-dependent 2,4-dichlorophenoxyacetate dioxygenase